MRQQKTFFKDKTEIIDLLDDWDEPPACIASDRIMVDGASVAYMLRDEPTDNDADSGWQFFAGDESDEYCDNPDNFGIYHLNTVCNYSPDIMPLLHAPIGSAFIRDEAGNWIEDDFTEE